MMKKYRNLLPTNTKHDRVFVNYKNEKYGVQPVDIDTTTNLPKTIAISIELSNPSSYSDLADGSQSCWQTYEPIC